MRGRRLNRRRLLAGLAALATAPASAGGDPLVRELAATWPVRFARLGDHPELSHAAWVSLVRNRDARAAAEAGHGAAVARAHGEAAAAYRWAAVAAAHAWLGVFEARRLPTDPVASWHLLAVSRAILGDRAAAAAAAARVPPGGPAEAWAAAWRPWLGDAGARFPPPLPLVALPGVTPGAWPEPTPDASYPLPLEPPAIEPPRVLHDPTPLVALSAWHEAAARAVPGIEPTHLDRWLAPHAWPGARTAPPALVGDDGRWLYGTGLLVSGDVGFVADASLRGAPAVAEWAPRSVSAALAARIVGPGGVDVAAALDLALAVEAALETAGEKAAGRWEGYHELFARIAASGLLRTFAAVAAGQGQPEAEGSLRLASFEGRWDRHAPVSEVFRQVAWDCARGNGTRAADRAESWIARDPALTPLRSALDALQLRVGFAERR